MKAQRASSGNTVRPCPHCRTGRVVFRVVLGRLRRIGWCQSCERCWGLR